MAEIQQNILYITLEHLYLHHENDLLKVEKEKTIILKIPLHHLQGIVIFGNSIISPSLMKKCLEGGIYLSYLTERGKFLGRLEGANSGNVLLRKTQIQKCLSDSYKVLLAKCFIAGKIQNQRLNLLRTAREIEDTLVEEEIRIISQDLEKSLESLEKATSLDSIRGIEGMAAKKYFSVFNHCLINQKEEFNFSKRMKRPPRSRINAMLSFFYSIATNDCIAACQATGLDPYFGFLHEERPGRPSLALDLMEEFRPFIDRFVITSINRKQIKPSDFIERTGSVYLFKDEARKSMLTNYQTRKQEEIKHHYLNQKCRISDLFFLQARILARAIRGEIPGYMPYIWK